MSNVLRNVYPVLNMYCTGYAINVEKQKKYYHRLKQQVIGAWILAVPLLLLSMAFIQVPYSKVIQMILTIPVLLFLGTSFYTDVWKQVRCRRSNMDTLVTLCTSIAFLFSVFNTFFSEFWYIRGLEPHVYYEVIVLIIAFFLTGKLLEGYAHEGGQSMDERIAGIFVPIMLFLSVLTFFIWVFFGGVGMFSHALLSAVSVMIIACPCALSLATPIAMMAGIGKAAEKHILIKDTLTLEQMRNVDVVVFDKAGTLTEGHPTVSGWLWAQAQEEHFKTVLLAAEMKSEHPFAGIIVTVLEEEHIVPASLDGFESLSGKGVKVVYQGMEYWVGSHKLLKDYQVYLSDVLGDMLVQYESEGNSIVYFGRESELLAIIAIKDRIKATSVEAVKELRAQDIEICMLADDGERTASSVADSLGIIHYIADALPEDKELFIRELQLQGKTVAMVSRGNNNSQTLAYADVSIVLGKADLFLLPKAFRLSHQTSRLIRQNLFWAFIYNLIGIPIAAGILYPVYGILLTPLLVSVAMVLSSVSVILNSIKLKS